jgi:nicotinamide-nucleotide amidase
MMSAHAQEWTQAEISGLWPMQAFEPLLKPLAQGLEQRGWRMACAESCTGGWLAAVCTHWPGASGWFDRGWVTYSNQAKADMLGVPALLIEQSGAVSEPVACAMAQGALSRSVADVSVALTGVAGPSGGSAEKPVGTVWLAWATRETPAQALCLHASGSRSAIRQAAVVAALRVLVQASRV